jgi:DNA-directed RNA polymerase specialized sigma24 family protein
MTDLGLWNQWRIEADKLALHALISRHRPMVHAACLRMLNDTTEAEIATNDCFRALRDFKANSPIRNLCAWLHSTAVRLSKERSISNYTPFPTLTNTLDEAIGLLPELHRLAIVDSYLGRRSRTEIARRLGLSRRLVNMTIYKGIELLQESLQRGHVIVSSPAVSEKLNTIDSEIRAAGRTAYYYSFTKSAPDSDVILN